MHRASHQIIKAVWMSDLCVKMRCRQFIKARHGTVTGTGNHHRALLRLAFLRNDTGDFGHDGLA